MAEKFSLLLLDYTSSHNKDELFQVNYENNYTITTWLIISITQNVSHKQCLLYFVMHFQNMSKDFEVTNFYINSVITFMNGQQVIHTYVYSERGHDMYMYIAFTNLNYVHMFHLYIISSILQCMYNLYKKCTYVHVTNYYMYLYLNMIPTSVYMYMYVYSMVLIYVHVLYTGIPCPLGCWKDWSLIGLDPNYVITHAMAPKDKEEVHVYMYM